MGAWGDAAALPPELNYTLHSMGDLGESLMQAAAGHEMLADMLIAEMTAMGLNTSTTAMVAGAVSANSIQAVHRGVRARVDVGSHVIDSGR